MRERELFTCVMDKYIFFFYEIQKWTRLFFSLKAHVETTVGTNENTYDFQSLGCLRVDNSKGIRGWNTETSVDEENLSPNVLDKNAIV